MSDSRLQTLLQMLHKYPADSFTKYAIGLEYVSMEELVKAKDIFEELRSSDPGYHPTYYQLGKVYEKLGDESAAKKVYEQGIYVTAGKGELHEKSELEQAINDLLI